MDEKFTERKKKTNWGKEGKKWEENKRERWNGSDTREVERKALK